MSGQKSSKVVDITSRKERWHTAYTLAGLQVSVSNHGRLYIQVDGSDVYLDMTDAVDFMARVSEKYEKIAEL